jgi:competence protein ComEC
MAKYISPHLLLHFGILISALGLHWLGSNFGWMTYKNSRHLLIAGIVAAALVALMVWSARLRRLACIGLIVSVIFLFSASFVFRASERLGAQIGSAIEGKSLTLTGVVSSLPAQYERSKTFNFFIEKCALEDASDCAMLNHSMLGQVIRLSWSQLVPSNLLPGQRWRLVVTAKQVVTRLNPSLFDAELRFFEEAIIGLGTVRVKSDSPAVLVGDLRWSIEGWRWWAERTRHYLRAGIESAMAAKSADRTISKKEVGLAKAIEGILVALVVGDQGAIPSSWWEIFNQTGVGHLMSISGLHVTMMAGVVSSLAVWVWQCSVRLCSASMRDRMPSKVLVRWITGTGGAWLYTALAGFGIPAQRTCWMVSLAAVAILSGRTRSALAVILFSGSAVVVIDPWAVLSAGFWLSFGAVSAIIYFGSATQIGPKGASKLAKASASSLLSRLVDKLRLAVSNGWQSQFAATAALLPVGAAFFSTFALLSPVANAVAIPLVSMVVTPLAMLGAILSASGASILGDLCLRLGSLVTEPLLTGLMWLSTQPGAVAVLGQPTSVALALAFFGLLLLLSPGRHLPPATRFAGALALIPIAVQPSVKPSEGDVWLTAFDVGQGSAILVETHRRVLVFDSGPSSGSESDSGSKIVAPYLRSRGISRLDAIIISHPSKDHTGGFRSIEKAMSPTWIASAASQTMDAFTGQILPCRQGDSWQWDSVKFEFLHPPELENKSGKYSPGASSCVLKITATNGSALLSSDIEVAQEKFLVNFYRRNNQIDRLKADVLLAPNHGSKKSSSAIFLDAVNPKSAVFQVGYRNRQKLPAAEVEERYKQRDIRILRTDHDGAIQLSLNSGIISTMRASNPPYWRTQPIKQSALLEED